jgi:hypothetical protein
MKFLIRKPFIFYFIGIFLLYLIALFLVSDFGSTLFLALQYIETVKWGKLALSVLLSLLIGIFIAINSCYLIKEYTRRRKCREGTVLTSVGVIAGLSVGVCPLCVGGLLPLLLGFLGVSFSFGVLPWQGLEVQLIVLGVMVYTTYMFIKKKQTSL